MKNHDGKGFHEIGERYPMSCGCIMIPDNDNFNHYVNPDCPFDNTYHPKIRGYIYRSWSELPARKLKEEVKSQ